MNNPTSHFPCFLSFVSFPYFLSLLYCGPQSLFFLLLFPDCSTSSFSFLFACIFTLLVSFPFFHFVFPFFPLLSSSELILPYFPWTLYILLLIPRLHFHSPCFVSFLSIISFFLSFLYCLLQRFFFLNFSLNCFTFFFSFLVFIFTLIVSFPFSYFFFFIFFPLLFSPELILPHFPWLLHIILLILHFLSRSSLSPVFFLVRAWRLKGKRWRSIKKSNERKREKTIEDRMRNRKRKKKEKGVKDR